MNGKKHIRFDWAIKRLLRNKANFVVLEGFLSELLFEKVIIQEIIESESNQKKFNDKLNRVDILVKNAKGEILLVEVQNEREYDYFHRMNYAQAKLISEHIKLGEAYHHVKKVFSISIVYFELGQGEDYIYKGKTEFTGMHNHDVLQLSLKQKELYNKELVSDMFATFYILKVNNFDKEAVDTLDEWIYFLKTSEIKDNFKAQGMKEAKEILDVDKLSPKDRAAYNRHLENLRYEASRIETLRADEEDRVREDERAKVAHAIAEAQQREAEAQKREAEAQKREAEALAKIITLAKLLLQAGISTQIIAKETGLTISEIEALIEEKIS